MLTGLRPASPGCSPVQALNPLTSQCHTQGQAPSAPDWGCHRHKRGKHHSPGSWGALCRLLPKAPALALGLWGFKDLALLVVR